MSKKLGRNVKRNAEYYSHYVNRSKTVRLLQANFGNDGYAVWYKLLELCTHADEHLGCLNDEIDMLDFLDYALVDELRFNNIMKFLIKIGKVDEGLWINSKEIWIQKLVDNLIPLYEKRVGGIPSKPKKRLSDTETMISGTEKYISDTENNISTPESISDTETPQSKGSIVSKGSNKGDSPEKFGGFKPLQLEPTNLDDIIKYWNTKKNLPNCRFLSLNLSLSDEHKQIITHYNPEEIKKAIDNYSNILSNDPESFPMKYKEFKSFLQKGVVKFCDEAMEANKQQDNNKIPRYIPEDELTDSELAEGERILEESGGMDAMFRGTISK